MRPTWNAATIVEPLENVSGSTSVAWFVVADATQVACENGSLLIGAVPADAGANCHATARTAVVTATRSRREPLSVRIAFPPKDREPWVGV